MHVRIYKRIPQPFSCAIRDTSQLVGTGGQYGGQVDPWWKIINIQYVGGMVHGLRGIWIAVQSMLLYTYGLAWQALFPGASVHVIAHIWGVWGCGAHC